MPQAISSAVDKAKSTLGEATPKAQTPVAKATSVPAYSASLPKMHIGGDVPKTGDYKLQKGEHVSPARSSEYRKVFEQRGAAGKHKWGGQPSHPQSNENGGNSPAPKGEEKHDEPKAKKGIKDNVNS